MRVFVGVFPPLAQRRDIRATLDTARKGPRLRWTRAENLHVTLQFLGEVEAHRVADVVGAVDRAAAKVDPFELVARGLGAFPAPERARVLFLELVRGREALAQLFGAIQSGLPADLRPEATGPYHPHLTIARPKRPPRIGAMEDLREELAPWQWRCEVRSVEVVESVLGSGGARYSVRHSAALGGLRPPFAP